MVYPKEKNEKERTGTELNAPFNCIPINNNALKPF
jgi:hypothetical protein